MRTKAAWPMTASDKRVQTDEELYSGAYGYIPCNTSVVLVYTCTYQYIEVYTIIYQYMTEQTIHTVIYNDKPCTKTYITVPLKSSSPIKGPMEDLG